MEYKDYIKFINATTFDANMKMAELAIENNDVEGAIDFYTKAIELESHSVFANVQKLFLLLKLYKYQEAILVAENLIKLEPAESNHLKTLAVCYLSLKKYEKSIFYFSKAIEQNPNNFNLYHFRGEAFFKFQKYYKAFFDFTKSIEIKQDSVGAYIYRGRTRGQLTDYYGAIDDFKIVLNSFPEDSTVLYLTGVTYLHLEDSKNAEIFLSKASRLGNKLAMEVLDSKH